MKAAIWGTIAVLALLAFAAISGGIAQSGTRRSGRYGGAYEDETGPYAPWLQASIQSRSRSFSPEERWERQDDYLESRVSHLERRRGLLSRLRAVFAPSTDGDDYRGRE